MELKINIKEGITLISLSDCPGGANFLAEVLAQIAAGGTDVDMIALTPSTSEKTAMSFTVSDEDFAKVLAVTAALQKENKALKVSVSGGYAKITAGSGKMDGCPGVAARIFAALSAVEIAMVTTALTEISFL
ncbi:MAG: hypothetical protein FWG82_00205, partial [Oscillospiraceae bacterium]|nr:hypothetical protein [Oscillospiraceae bacterium]